MSNAYSIQDLFKKNITKDEFITKFTEINTSSAVGSVSVFGTGNVSQSVYDTVANANKEETAAQQTETEQNPNAAESFIKAVAAKLFDKVDTNSNQIIDTEEIQTAATLVDDGDNGNVVSENDLGELYNKIFESISVDNPEDMYNDAINKEVETLKASGYSEEEAKQLAVYTSDLVLNLDNEIDYLTGHIALIKINSDNLVDSYQNEIDKIQKKQKVDKLNTEKDKTEAKIKKAKAEIERNKKEIEELAADISKLDPETDESEIKNKQSQISSKQNSIAKNENNIIGLNAKLTEINHKLDNAQKDINDYETKIKEELASTQNDIARYEAKLQSLKAAREYAAAQNISNPPLGNVSTVDASRFHTNDNAMSFDDFAQKGIQYSSSTGVSLAQKVRSNVIGFSGYCARYANNALQSEGLITQSERTGSAYQMADNLDQNDNFQEITVSSADDLKKLPAGCVLVYDKGAAGYSAKHGHIEITLGDGTAASDGITRNLRYSKGLRVFVPIESNSTQAA